MYAVETRRPEKTQTAKRTIAKNSAEKLTHQRLSTLQLAEALGNVSEACLVRGRDVPDNLLKVCYDLSEPKTRRLEFQALGEELGLMEGTVLTCDESGPESIGDSGFAWFQSGPGC